MSKFVIITLTKADTKNYCIGCIFRDVDYCIKFAKELGLEPCGKKKHYKLMEVKN